MNSNRDYWNRKIIAWEDSISQKENVPLIERIASLFRQPLKFRTALALNILNGFVKDKTVLELGCGSGYFAFKLFEVSEMRHVTGIDISRRAVERASQIASERQLTDRFTFLEGDVTTKILPEADVTIGLGFLDYLSPEEIRLLFKNIRSPYFLFSFADKRISLRRYIHKCYMLSQGCSKHYYYDQNEMSAYIGKKHGNTRFLTDKKMSFTCIVHNVTRSSCT
jgi:SAM-dependent methyltransferase